MSWLFSQALVAEYSEDTSSGGEPSAPLNVMPSLRPFWRNDKPMDVCARSPFGLTWRRLTDDRGAELLTWFLAGFPARTSVAPAREQESTARKAGCGASTREYLAKYDPVSRSWKTAQCLLLGGLEPFSGTWPRWGSMRNGVCYQRQTPSGLSALRAVIDQSLTTSGSESGSSQRAPTPKATEAGPDFAKMDRSATGISLQTFSAMTQRAPTPTSSCGNVSGTVESEGNREYRGNLMEYFAKTQRAPTARSEDSQCAGGRRGTADTLVAFTRLPTSCANEDAAGTPNGKMQRMLGNCEEVRNSDPGGGQLNPQWEDWFMGWPIGWTDVRHSATDRFRQWSDLHGGCSHMDEEHGGAL